MGIKTTYRGGEDSGRGDDPHGHMKTYHNYVVRKEKPINPIVPSDYGDTPTKLPKDK